MIMSGEVNKWGVKAALDCESFQNSPAVDSYGFVCSMSHNDWGRMVTSHQPGASEALLRVLEGGSDSQGISTVRSKQESTSQACLGPCSCAQKAPGSRENGTNRYRHR